LYGSKGLSLAKEPKTTSKEPKIKQKNKMQILPMFNNIYRPEIIFTLTPHLNISTVPSASQNSKKYSIEVR